jgi:uncharacterized membrane protein YhhN
LTLILVAVSATLAVCAAPWALDASWLAWVFKPLTTVLLIAWAWPRGAGDPARRWLLIGLVWSLAGDVALLWPDRGFLPGLVSFLLAHMAYIVAFTRGGTRAWWPAWLGYALLAGVILSQLWPGIPAPLRGPVLVYVGALASMAALAAGRWQALRTPGARWAAVGGALFLASDATLAINRFGAPVPLSGLWILLSYWLAQACIAASLNPPVKEPR